MRRLLLNFTLLFVLLSFCSLSCLAGGYTRLDNITITELKNSIDILLNANDNVNYNVINYMNGDIGISLQDTALGKNLQTHSSLNISQQKDIDSAGLIQESPSEVLIRLSGTDLKNKELKVRNDIKKSHIIIIEPEQTHPNIAAVPLSGDTVTLPDFSNFEVDPKLNTKAPEIRQPISMFSIEEKKPARTSNRKLIAQARNYRDDTSILDLGDDLFKKDSNDQKGAPQPQPEAAPAANPDSAIAEPPPQNLDPEQPEENKLAEDIINIDSEETVVEPAVTADATTQEASQQELSLVGKALFFIKTHWIWFAGGGACLIIGFIILAVLGSMMNRQNMQALSPDPQDPHQEIPQQQAPKQKSQQVIDDEPVEFIAPANHKNSQSISEAINHIISIRDMTGR